MSETQTNAAASTALVSEVEKVSAVVLPEPLAEVVPLAAAPAAAAAATAMDAAADAAAAGGGARPGAG